MMQFHSMQAYLEYKENNRVLFYSYSTPMLLYNALSSEVILRDQYFSRTTTKQVNRFIREFKPNQVIKLKKEDFLKYLSIL